MTRYEEMKTDRLAREIFEAFPYEDCPGLKLYVLSCGCIFYQRVYRDGSEGAFIGAYRDPADGPCGECTWFPGGWEDRVCDVIRVYNMGLAFVRSDPHREK